MSNYIKACFLVCLISIQANLTIAEDSKVKIGISTILTGDLASMGQNVVQTVETYNKHFARHKFGVVVQDSKLSGADGLSAFQALINVSKADIIIACTSTNGILAAASLINSSRTATIGVATAGKSIDQAGAYVFRLANNDALNGKEQAELFIDQGIKKVALLMEETEYTRDVGDAFVDQFTKLGGVLSENLTFPPGQGDFRAEVTKIIASHPSAVFMPTQTGSALGIFLKQFKSQGGQSGLPIHTTFVAATNQDAFKLAGDSIYGVKYMAPKYNPKNSRYTEFLSKYVEDYKHTPPVPFHTAATVDALDFIQDYLDKHSKFVSDDFIKFLLTNVKDYNGALGTYSFDQDGNTDLGFSPAEIRRGDPIGLK